MLLTCVVGFFDRSIAWDTRVYFYEKRKKGREMKLQKWHLLKHLKTNGDIIAYAQEILENYNDKKTLEDTLRVCCWALRLRRPRMCLWLWKLHLKTKRNKK